MHACRCITPVGGLVDPLRVVDQVAEGPQSPEPRAGLRLKKIPEQLRHGAPSEGHRSQRRVCKSTGHAPGSSGPQVP